MYGKKYPLERFSKWLLVTYHDLCLLLFDPGLSYWWSCLFDPNSSTLAILLLKLSTSWWWFVLSDIWRGGGKISGLCRPETNRANHRQDQRRRDNQTSRPEYWIKLFVREEIFKILTSWQPAGCFIKIFEAVKWPQSVWWSVSLIRWLLASKIGFTLSSFGQTCVSHDTLTSSHSLLSTLGKNCRPVWPLTKSLSGYVH